MARLTVLIFLLLAPAARAAPLVERPFEPIAQRGVATCLRATGGSELALYAPRGVALHEGARVKLGELFDCAATATAGDAAVTAAVVQGGARGLQVRAAVRDGGGAFGRPVGLGGAADDTTVAAAVSPAGQALVAWVQGRGTRNRVVAVRRPPGGTFGAIEPLTDWRRGNTFAEPHVAAAMASDGRATVAWALPTPDRDADPAPSLAASVGAATAAPKDRFTFQRLAATQDVSRVALAVAPDGWALLAYDERDAVHVLERPGGAAAFSEALTGEASDMPVVAVRNGGGGLVAWRTSTDEETAGLLATARPGAGPFPAPRTIAPDTAHSGRYGWLAGTVATEVPLDAHNGALRAALAPDGRAVLGWTAGERRSAYAAIGTLAAGFGPPVALSSPLRAVNGVAPLFDRQGRAALAWTDNTTEWPDFPLGHGRLHLAVESAPPLPEPSRPRVTVTTPARQRVYPSQPLRVRVRCDRACDLAATALGHDVDIHPQTRTLTRAGTVRIALRGSYGRRPAWRTKRLRVRVRASAPGAHDVVTATRRVVIARRPARPVPRLLGVQAVRRGRSIVVSWETASPVRRVIFGVYAQHGRRLTPATLRAGLLVRARGQTRFRVRLRPEHPARFHWVRVIAISPDRPHARQVLVPIR